MFPEEKLSFLDFDIYSKRISFFYKNKEKLGSTFGFILTILYAIASLIIFSSYLIKTIKREEVILSDSIIYPTTIPSIDINNNIFNIAFGLENLTNLKRFTDESIYYPKVFYIEKKKENGEFEIISQKELNVEICQYNKIEKEYQYLFDNINNSYCLKDFNLTLSGGFKFNKMSFIQISIYPCVNTSENSNHCKPQNIIDKYLSSTYFSVLTKDIGINPSNFTFPTVPIAQNLYSTVDKNILNEFIMYFRITEIDTDIGLFTYDIKKEVYLKYNKELHYFNFIKDEEYKSKTEILTAEIRLEDDIYYHKRTYTKMSQVFSTIGGYMQFIYTSFALLSLLTKKISIELKLINSLFNFNIKERKIILCVEYKKKLEYISSLDKRRDNYIQYQAKKPIIHIKNKEKNKKSSTSLFNKNHNFEHFKKSETGQKAVSSIANDLKSQNIISIGGLNRIYNNLSNDKEKEQNTIINEQSINRSKINFMESNSHLNDIQINKIFDQRNNLINNFKLFEKKSLSNIDFSLFDYYCLRKITKKKPEIELFRFGFNFYKSQMDIINFINIALLTQIMLTHQTETKHNVLNQTIELSIN